VVDFNCTIPQMQDERSMAALLCAFDTEGNGKQSYQGFLRNICSNTSSRDEVSTPSNRGVGHDGAVLPSLGHVTEGSQRPSTGPAIAGCRAYTRRAHTPPPPDTWKNMSPAPGSPAYASACDTWRKSSQMVNESQVRPNRAGLLNLALSPTIEGYQCARVAVI
jgi:hypothetical protein